MNFRKLTNAMLLGLGLSSLVSCAYLPLDGNYFKDLDDHFANKEKALYSPGKDFPLTKSEEKEESEQQEEGILSSVFKSNRKPALAEADSERNLDTNERYKKVDTASDQLEQIDPRSRLVTKRSVHGNDIFYGMGKNDVIRVWGKPGRVEIAGHPSYENERWSFFEGGEVKQVYFESGRVQGWALDL